MAHNNIRLERDFFSRPTLIVAEALLGARLVRIDNGQRISGIIVETEAYCGETDLACHARIGRTPRTVVMYGPPGHAYVYFTYGIHWMLNVVTETEGFPAAILIRSIIPDEGIELISRRRHPQPTKDWTNGPAKICQALNITGSFNDVDMCADQRKLFFEESNLIRNIIVKRGARVGMNKVPEPWYSIDWRFLATID